MSHHYQEVVGSIPVDFRSFFVKKNLVEEPILKWHSAKAFVRELAAEPRSGNKWPDLEGPIL